MASFRAFIIVFTVVVTSMRLFKTVDGNINTDHTVATKPYIEVIEGTNVTMPCRYDRDVFAVYWYRGASSSVDSLIMYLDVFYGGGERGYGPSNFSKRYNMTDNYSLIMHGVSMEDEGQFLCEVSDRIKGTIYRNYTNVTVIGLISPPSPASRTVLPVVLPLVGVFCIVVVIGLLQKKKRDAAVTTAGEETSEGPSESRIDAHDLAGTSSGEETNGRPSDPLLDNQDPAVTTEGEETSEMPSESDIRNSLDQMRDKIKNYKPMYSGTVDLGTNRLTLGFFGPSGAEITALIDSLRFALQGTYKATQKPRADGQPTPMREEQSLMITEHIFIIEHHGMVIQGGENEMATATFDVEAVAAALTGGKIHCPVLVLEIRENIPGWEARLVTKFSQIAEKSFRENYKVVLTRTATMDKDAATKLSLSTRAALEDIHLVENYTRRNHVENAERSLELLRFLWKCIEAGEGNLEKAKAKARSHLMKIIPTDTPDTR